jgi:hypothetical protein
MDAAEPAASHCKAVRREIGMELSFWYGANDASAGKGKWYIENLYMAIGHI